MALVLDHAQLRDLAGISGLPIGDVAQRMRDAGATDVAITEHTVREMLSGGAISSVPVELPGGASDQGIPQASLVGPPEMIRRIHRSVVTRLSGGKDVAEIVQLSAFASRLNLYSIGIAEISGLGIGYARDGVWDVKGAGLGFVPRPRADGNQWGAATADALDWASDLEATLVIFAGNATLGHPESLEDVAIEMLSRDLVYGYVEFGKQHGDAALATKMPGDFVRVHSISESEMLGMPQRRAVDRFALAVRERNIRACYVRLFPPSSYEPMASAEGYVGEIATRLRADGFSLGHPRPHSPLGVSPWLRWMVMVGALASVALCLMELLATAPVVTLIGLGAAILLSAAGMWVSPNITAQGCALLAAMALPTYAVARHRPSAEALGRWAALAKGLLLYAVAAGTSLLGGLFIVGCLAETKFMLKLDQFRGVKPSQFVPLVAVLLILMGWDLGADGAGDDESRWRVLMRGWRKAAEGVVRYWHVAALLIGVAGMAVLIMRSGNDSGLGVSVVELKFRALMDRAFGVRPRTKEVLIGYPFLVLGLARMLAGKQAGRWIILSVGTVGLVSLVNTFSHLHTPVEISLSRALHGLWLGAALGVVLYAICEIGETCWRRLASGSPRDGGE